MNTIVKEAVAERKAKDSGKDGSGGDDFRGDGEDFWITDALQAVWR